jgi:M6 family metalloprotease-like protein
MKKSRLLAVGVCMSLLVMSSSTSVSAAPTQTFKNCSQLLKKYKWGVALNRGAAGDLRKKIHVLPKVYKANKRLDKDKDGVACEKESLQRLAPVSTSTPTINPIEPIAPVLVNIESCKLKDKTLSQGGTLGFPRVPIRLPSTGRVRIGVIFADFADSVATDTTEHVLKQYSPDLETYFSNMSYGRLNIELVPAHNWARMSKNSTSYRIGRGEWSWLDFSSFLEEAIRLGSVGVDITAWDSFIVLANSPNVMSSSLSPPPGYAIVEAGGKRWTNGLLLGTDAGYFVAAMQHEVGHNFGLLDLYPYTGTGFRYTGDFSLMGSLWGTAPELFAWERWTLNWLEDTQVGCIESGSVTASLSPVSISGGQKMIVSPISESKALVVEVRRRAGYDKALIEEGPLAYVVDTSKSGGYGTIKVLPLLESDGIKSSAPLNLGETIEFEGISVTYKSRNALSDEIIVTRSS